jgi:hypothetical protein
MKGLLTLAGLEPAERSLVLRTVFLVAGVRAALWMVPFRRLPSLLRAFDRLPLSVPREMPVARLVWAVRAASRRIPGASCLTQSLALHCLLMRAGHPSEVRIGVTNDSSLGFQAHAWVEHAGRTWLSAPPETALYVKLFSWGGRQI